MTVSRHKAASAFTSELAKVANPVPSAGDVGMKYLQLAALALPVAAASSHIVSSVYDKMTAASRQAGAFKAMMEQNPHLHDRDKTTVQRYFNTLYHVNPHLAHEPTIAASYVNNMLTTSDPAKGFGTQPHRDIFQTALSAGGRGGGGAFGGAGDTLESMGKALGTLHKNLDSSEQQKILAQAQKMRDQAQGIQDTAQDRLRQRHLQFARSRARSAQGKLEKSEQQVGDVTGHLHDLAVENQHLADILEQQYGHRF